MATVIFDELETAVIVSAEASSRFRITETETAVILDNIGPSLYVGTTTETAIAQNPEPTVIPIATVYETAVIVNPEPTQGSYELLSDTFAVQDSIDSLATRVLNRKDVFTVQDYVSPSAFKDVDVTETAAIADTASFSNPSTTLTDTAHVTDNFSVQATRTSNLSETLLINDYASVGEVWDVLDNAIVVDAVALGGTLSTSVIDTAQVQDYVSLQESVTLVVTESVTVNDAPTTTLTANTVITEEVFASNYISIPVDATDAIVFTANTVNWAMSRYTQAPLTSKVFEYVSTENGLYIQTAEYADSSIETGFTNFNSPQLKHVQYAYVYSEHENPAAITITADINGIENEYEYIQMARDASDTRAVRCQFGRGFRSSYFKLRLDSEGYVKTQAVLPNVESVSRRI